MKFATTTILALLSLMNAASSVEARKNMSLRRQLDSSDDEGVSERDCELEIEDGVEVEFGCKSKTKSELMEMKDKIKFKVKYDDKGLKVKVKYEQEIETETPKEDKTEDVEDVETAIEAPEDRRRLDVEQTTETEYEVVFDRLIEYMKPSGSATAASALGEAYDWEQDSIIGNIDLTNLSPFSPVETKADGSYSWYITTVDGVVKFIFTIFPSGNGESVSANSMKIDVDIKGYTWTESDSHLAVLASVESGTEVDIEYEDDKKEQPSDVLISFASSVNAGAFVPFGEFTWARDAVVVAAGENATIVDDGNMTASVQEVGNATATSTISVMATSPSDGSNSIAFSFVGALAQGAEEIFWDPEAGINYAPSGAFGFSHSTSLIGLLAFVGLTFLG